VTNQHGASCARRALPPFGVRDFVGYGDANGAEGGHAAPGTSNTTDVQRAGGGATTP